MLGYIKIYRNELKVKHIQAYKDIYCRLCSVLGDDYGLLYRLFVSYDVTFFVSIFDALSERKSRSQIKCSFNKRINKSILISDLALEYGSLISIYWIIQKINDDKTDNEFSLKNLILNFLLKHNKKISCKLSLYENILNVWNNQMKYYYEIEKKQSSTFDMLINGIGNVYGTVFRSYAKFANVEVDEDILFDLGFNIGIYIFLMDAYDDYFKDIKKNKFNPITKMLDYDEIKNDKQKTTEKLQMLTQFLVSKIRDAALQLNLQDKPNSFIAENVIIYGMNYVYSGITQKRYRKRKCKKCCN